jgi:hypothetical protein
VMMAVKMSMVMLGVGTRCQLLRAEVCADEGSEGGLGWEQM